jgi:hypothetical protein
MGFEPYAPPAAPAAAIETCPRCGGHDVRTPAFTWWGGAIGPRMLNHRVCGGCKLGFNAKTRKSNTRAIVIYQVVSVAVALCGLFAFWVWNGERSATAFIDGCTSSCAKGGSPQETCQRLCECVTADLRRGGDAHFRQLLSEAARTGKPPSEMGEAAARCGAQ